MASRLPPRYDLSVTGPSILGKQTVKAALALVGLGMAAGLLGQDMR